MRGSRIGSIWGIPVLVDISLLLALPVVGWWIQRGVSVRVWIDVLTEISPHTVRYSAIDVGLTPWLVGAVVFFGFLASLLVHDLVQTWLARRYGVETRYIMLWVFGSLSQFDYSTKYFEREAPIALAGLLTSALLTGLFTAVLWAIPGDPQVVVVSVGLLAMFNGVVWLANLFPIFPFDGALLLRSLLCRVTSTMQATRIVSVLGQVLAVVIIFYAAFVLDHLLFGLVAVFFFFSAMDERQFVRNRLFLADTSVSEFVRRREPCVPSKTLVDDFLAEERLDLSDERAFPVCDGDGAPVGVLTTDALRSWTDRTGVSATTNVGKLVSEDVASIPEGETALTAYLLFRDGTKYVLVSYPDDIGVLTASEFLHMLDVRQQIAAVNLRNLP
ncbi:hypothetical protein [Haladaptatus sp. CMAA 1911]|uniref:hypothetical protein n=1 Tax=unclassified Haladaptatus TaxID=2622732 RepID=UPI00375442F9